MDKEHSWFAEEGRNIRLSLASDGFNPVGMQNVTYSIWPVILIPYNLPPWLCQKQSNWLLSICATETLVPPVSAGLLAWGHR